MRFFRPFKPLRRLWMWLTHRHDWLTVYSLEFRSNDNTRCFGVLERCYCGRERGWTVRQTLRCKLDVLWLHEHAKLAGVDLVNH